MERTIDETGREVLVYPSGLIKDAKNGQIIKGMNETPITKDPRGMLALRNAKSKQIAAEAIDEGAGVDPSLYGTGEGWRKLIAHATRTFLKSGNIRGMAEILAKLGIAAGYLSREETPTVPAGRISGTPESIRQLLVILDEEIKTRTEKAAAIEGQSK